MTIHDHLIQIGACMEARLWASQYKTAQEVWDNCNRVDWLFWWAARIGQHKQVGKVAVEIAKSIKHLNNRYAAAHAADATNAATSAADAAATATNAAANTAGLNATYVANAVSAAAADAATYAANAACIGQNKLNLKIAKKHLVCPWHESETTLQCNAPNA